MNLRDLQSEIGTWHVRTFPVCPRARIEAKLMEECEELVTATDDAVRAEEIADCIIVLLALATREGIDAEGCVRAKFAVVKGRDQAKRDRDKCRPASASR